jgi:hypothetical protein
MMPKGRQEMKIKDIDYKTLSDYMESAIAHCGVETIKEHRSKLLGRDTDLRFAWDVWSVARRVDSSAATWLSDTLYAYLNDDHISTALKHFVKNYPAIAI